MTEYNAQADHIGSRHTFVVVHRQDVLVSNNCRNHIDSQHNVTKINAYSGWII